MYFGFLMGVLFGVVATVSFFIYVGHRSPDVNEFITYRRVSDAKRRVNGVLRNARRSMNQATGTNVSREYGLWEDML